MNQIKYYVDMINNKYLKEAEEIEKRWKETGTLDNIKKIWNKQVCAVLLESQRLINEQPTNTSDISQFKRISIPLIRRIYPKLIPNEVVGVEEMEPIKKNPDYRSIDDPWDALQDGN